MTFIFSCIALLVSLSLFIASKFTKPLVFLPIVSIISALSLALLTFYPQDMRQIESSSDGLLIHISLSMVGFGLYAITTLFALQMVFIHQQLKHKKKSLLRGDLPPLMWVEDILRKLMVATLILLSVTLATGFAFVPQFLADGYLHKTMLSSLALLVLIATLAIDQFKGLSSHNVLWLNGLGLTFLFLSYFGSRFVKEVILA